MLITPETAAGCAEEKRKLAGQMHTSMERVASIDREVKEFENFTMADIADEVDEAGKARFSNGEKREAELQRRCNANKSLADLTVEREAAAREVARLRMEHEYQSDMLSICLQFAPYQG